MRRSAEALLAGRVCAVNVVVVVVLAGVRLAAMLAPNVVIIVRVVIVALSALLHAIVSVLAVADILVCVVERPVIVVATLWSVVVTAVRKVGAVVRCAGTGTRDTSHMRTAVALEREWVVAAAVAIRRRIIVVLLHWCRHCRRVRLGRRVRGFNVTLLVERGATGSGGSCDGGSGDLTIEALATAFPKEYPAEGC